VIFYSDTKGITFLGRYDATLKALGSEERLESERQRFITLWRKSKGLWIVWPLGKNGRMISV